MSRLYRQLSSLWPYWSWNCLTGKKLCRRRLVLISRPVTDSNPQKPENPWPNLICNIVLPAVIMMKLSHVDERGRAQMVDVGSKPDTVRAAVAKGEVHMRPETLRLIADGGVSKGDVLAVARLAGILAAKQTHTLIPLCHPLMLTHVEVDFRLDARASLIEVTATARTTGKTGVEMEALTAVGVAALTIYDMAKAVEKAMRITNIRLVRKRGGKSGAIVLEEQNES